jgi:hypothetical protein
MTFAAKYTPAQWAEAQRLRAEGLTFRAIAKNLGFNSPATVSTRARKEGWWGGENTGVAGLAKGKPRSASPATATIRRALAVRLYCFIELEMRMKELRMKKQLDAYEQSPDKSELPVVTKEERESFAALIQQINQVTEMASEPASAADGRRKSAKPNPELTALSDDIDTAGLAIASEKDDLRAELAERLGKLFPQS